MASDTLLWGTITAGAIIVLFVVLAQSPDLDEAESLWSSADEPDPLASVCLDHSGLTRHDHVTLKIFIEGDQQTVLEGIGINSVGAALCVIRTPVAAQSSAALSLVSPSLLWRSTDM